jgi:ureidoglycolate hydrolase
MTIPAHLLEVETYTGSGYKPLVYYGAWRIALMRYADEYLPQNITTMERHNETDEIFVLLQGQGMLFIGEGDERITQIYAEDMAPLTIYNVKRAVWHAVSFSRDATILIVENRDTSKENSQYCSLKAEQRSQIVELARPLGGQDAPSL